MTNYRSGSGSHRRRVGRRPQPSDRLSSVHRAPTEGGKMRGGAGAGVVWDDKVERDGVKWVGVDEIG